MNIGTAQFNDEEAVRALLQREELMELEIAGFFLSDRCILVPHRFWRSAMVCVSSSQQQQIDMHLLVSEALRQHSCAGCCDVFELRSPAGVYRIVGSYCTDALTN